MPSDEEITRMTETVAKMAATIYAAEQAACIPLWQNGSDLNGPTYASAISDAVGIYSQTVEHLGTRGLVV